MKKISFIKLAKKSAAKQISELKKINKVFNNSFVRAVESIYQCKGKVICAGVGKSGLIARKVSATLSSVGISSFFLSPSEANHGDLGQIDKKDLLLVFSYSGNTTELTNILKYANRFNIKIIGVASKPDSTLIKASDIKILRLFTYMNKQAIKKGGAVISLLGNHEILNSMGIIKYVTYKGLKQFNNYIDKENPDTFIHEI